MAIWSFIPKLLGRPGQQRRDEDVRDPREAPPPGAREAERIDETKTKLEQAIAANARELDSVNQRFHLALMDTGVSMSQQDRDLRYIWVHNAPHGLKKTEFVGHLQSEVMPPDIEPIIAQAKRRAMAERKPAQIEIHTIIEGKPRWFDEKISPIIKDDEVVGIMTTSIDTTIYRIQEEYMRDLLGELTHRTKNLLAVILGIARQSGRISSDIETFVTQFSGRIRTLSVTHELLVNANWTGVDLKALLQAVWRATSAHATTDVQLSGSGCRLAPESAQNLALAFHEMAANAAIGRDIVGNGAQVRIDWTREKNADGGLTLVWEQSASGGSDKVLDEFAKSYLEVLLPRATGGTSELVVADLGLRWTLELPARNFVL